MLKNVFLNNALCLRPIQDWSEAAKDSADLQCHTKFIELLFLKVKWQAT